jgi:hypothetical protein
MWSDCGCILKVELQIELEQGVRKSIRNDSRTLGLSDWKNGIMRN